jgi:peroxiredoxin
MSFVVCLAGYVDAQVQDEPPASITAGRYQALVADFAEAQRRVLKSIEGMSLAENQRWTEQSIRDLKAALKASKSFEERRSATLRYPGMLQVQYAELMREVAESAPVDPVIDEAKSLLTDVVETYADVRRPNSTVTLGPIARLELDELRGREAPVTEGMDVRGMPLRLSDYRGKVVVFSFTSQTCGPCKIEYPRYRDLARRYHDRPFAVLGVYQGTRESLRKEIESGAINWPCLCDGDEPGPIHQRWNIPGWPSLFILDQSGRVRFKGDQYRQPEALQRAVEALLLEAEARR